MQRPGVSSRNVMIVLEQFQGIGGRTQEAAPPNGGRAHWGVHGIRRALEGGGDAKVCGRVAPAPCAGLSTVSASIADDSNFFLKSIPLASPQARVVA
jgi:hypothetical protein